MIKVIICDFDGVLCSLNVDRALQLIKEHQSQLKIQPQELLEQYFFSNPFYVEIDSGMISYQDMLFRIAKYLWLGKMQDWELLWEGIWNAYEVDSSLKDFLVRSIKSGLQVGILTDNHRDFRAWINSRHDLSDFQWLLTCSGEEGITKPVPQIFRKALEPFNVSFEEALYLDDNIVNTSTASKLGIKAVHYHSFNSTEQELLAVVSSLG